MKMWHQNLNVKEVSSSVNTGILYFPIRVRANISNFTLYQGVKLIFTGGHISLAVAFKGPNVILGLYKCNYSLTVKRELGAAAG